MSLKAYTQATARAENPRQSEYRLFSQVTHALIEAEGLDTTDIGGRMQALDWNRRLWSTLATDCADPGNALPQPLRAQIISISLWVSRYTSLVMQREEDIGPLVEINRMVMQGLAGAPQPQPQAA
ncbi:flagellar biosynthesis regulator FlaF [Brevundimonas sp.]|uniref:flagellar biosynthesis regulator FlaF n=1 Tax=Brevundimonas sp. TaxID=1871086 RepID=UPI0035B14178